MRNTIAIATFLAVGASAVGVSALDLRGSDTLKDVTLRLLSSNTLDCGGVGNTPAGDLVYLGTGSGNGQSSMVGDTQEVAPMSRAMNTGVCSGTAAAAHSNGTKAEGIVFALDGISVVAKSDFASCAGSPSCGTDSPPSGLRFSGTIPGTSYTVTDWKDALRLLYFGAKNTDGATLANRNCGGPERAALANNWNALFQSCNSGNCPTGVQHAFRRNDESGTTDTFVTLLGVSAIGLGTNSSPFCNTATKGSGGVDGAGAATAQTPINAAEVLPAPLPGRTPYTGTHITVCANTASGYRGSYFTDLQDADVIRRTCVFTGGSAKEDVCSARGDLGLVLPIWDAPANGFPTADCTAGLFICQPAPRTNCTPPNAFETCPNGHDANVAGLCPVGQCSVPVVKQADNTLDPRCNALRGTNAPGDLVGAVYDGRVHNLTTWTSSGGLFSKASVPRATGYASPLAPTANIAMVGAYYRLHSIHSIATPNATCQRDSATDQIGCLVQASPCSIGFAGNSAVQGNTIALNVNNIAPIDSCVQNLVSGAGAVYPISRKLYLNTLDGFETLAAGSNQFKMSKCFANGTASTIATGAAPPAGFGGFVPLPSAPFCEDFNETQAGCVNAGGTNVDACAGNPF